MNDGEKQAVMLEIANLNQRYAQAADQADGTGYSRCFTENGVFDRFGTEIRGRAALAAMQTPNALVKRRHLIGNALVDFGNDGEVRGSGYLMVVVFDAEAGEQKPPVCIDFADVYQNSPEGWLIAHRAVRRAF